MRRFLLIVLTLVVVSVCSGCNAGEATRGPTRSDVIAAAPQSLEEFDSSLACIGFHIVYSDFAELFSGSSDLVTSRMKDDSGREPSSIEKIGPLWVGFDDSGIAFVAADAWGNVARACSDGRT